MWAAGIAAVLFIETILLYIMRTTDETSINTVKTSSLFLIPISLIFMVWTVQCLVVGKGKMNCGVLAWVYVAVMALEAIAQTALIFL